MDRLTHRVPRRRRRSFSLASLVLVVAAALLPASARAVTDEDDVRGKLDLRRLIAEKDTQAGGLTATVWTWATWPRRILKRSEPNRLFILLDTDLDGTSDYSGRVVVSGGSLQVEISGSGESFEPLPASRPTTRSVRVIIPGDSPANPAGDVQVAARSRYRTTGAGTACEPACRDRIPDSGWVIAQPEGDGDFLLASSFEQPVCGPAFSPGPGCEFGVEGDVVQGAYDPRTSEGAVRINRQGDPKPDGGLTHMGVVIELDLPDAHGFVGAAHRVPAFASNEVEFIALMQNTPSDGSAIAWPVEVRIYPGSRRLGLAAYGAADVALTAWSAPVDEWFYVVVEVSRGNTATQRMWVYDSNDLLVEQVSIEADTIQGNREKARQKLGGTASTNSPMYTYGDDWYFATANLGPVRVT